MFSVAKLRNLLFYNTFVNMLYNTWLHMASCLRTMILYMVERKYANGRKH